MKIREASVAGRFYPKDNIALLNQLKTLFKDLPSESKSCCVIAPHAGYGYSGKVAAISFNALEEAECFVVLSPNHTGVGDAISVSDADFWETPLGRVPVDKALREKLLGELGIRDDDLAHAQEHSCEVQLPFIQFLFPKAKILPITLMTNSLDALEKLGNALYKVCEGKSVGIIASGDFSHFVSEKEAFERDSEAIKFIEKMDYLGFHSLVLQKNLSICGLSPIVAAMVFCKRAGINKGRLLKYNTSASVTKDNESVVGYAAIKLG